MYSIILLSVFYYFYHFWFISIIHFLLPLDVAIQYVSEYCLVYHISVIDNGNVLIKFLFRFPLEIFSQLACTFVRLSSEFSFSIGISQREGRLYHFYPGSLCSFLPLS